MPSFANSYAALAEDQSESECEEVQMAVSKSDSQPLIAHPSHSSGGNVYMRIDPLVTANINSLTDVGFSDEDLEACLKVVNILSNNPNLFKLNNLRPLRQALNPLVLLQMETGGYLNSEGTCNKRKFVDRSGSKKKSKTRSDSPDSRLKELEKEYINQTQLRAIRLAQLEKLNDEQCDGVDSSMGQLIYRVPDGVGTSSVKTSIYRQPALLESGNFDVTDKTESNSSINALISSNSKSAEDAAASRKPVELQNPLSCYICHKPYRLLHFFYAQLCPDCASFNFAKRDEIADLRGKVCLVTGARAKIGFRCALKLLRCGAMVIVTTRFPIAATDSFLAEPDSCDWWNRLHVYGLDFRNISVLEKFCHFVNYTYARLDAIVNNACQTVRRPPAYYTHMMESERKPWQELSQKASTMLTPYRSFLGHLTHNENAEVRPQESSGASGAEFHQDNDPQSSPLRKSDPTSSLVTSAGMNVLTNKHGVTLPSQLSIASGQFFSSAEESQLALLSSDTDHSKDSQNFPKGFKDVNGSQVDLRRENSWTLRLHQVSTPELAEVMAINAMAPAVINARLKSLMERTGRVEGRGANGTAINGSSKPEEAEWKFIVNVSAMEGKFYRYKTKNHPHTNMAKASLNMMTRTSAPDYVTSHIYMTAVDTGWINDEKPLELAVKHEAKHNFQTPIDEIDAAARVLDPIIGPLNSRARGEQVLPPYGIFLKDFQKCEW